MFIGSVGCDTCCKKTVYAYFLLNTGVSERGLGLGKRKKKPILPFLLYI